jgi:hypothetical protein
MFEIAFQVPTQSALAQRALRMYSKLYPEDVQAGQGRCPLGCARVKLDAGILL